MAKVVGGELPLKAVLGLLTLRHSSDARVQEENIELLALVLPPRAKLPDRGKAGGVERMELQPGARMCSPDRGHCALRERPAHQPWREPALPRTRSRLSRR